MLLSLISIFIPAGLAQTTLDPSDQKVLNELEQQVGSIKEEVHRSKAKLHELEDAVLRGKITGSKALVDFENLAEGFFQFSSAEFYLDDRLIQKVDGEKRENPLKDLRVFDGDLPSGEHMLKVKIKYKGSDKSLYKAFSYFKDHKFELQTTERFAVDYGKTTFLKLTALDKGYFQGDIQKRLHLQVQVVQDWGINPPE